MMGEFLYDFFMPNLAELVIIFLLILVISGLNEIRRDING